jgi:hypothetical protein
VARSLRRAASPRAANKFSLGDSPGDFAGRGVDLRPGRDTPMLPKKIDIIMISD